MTEVALPGLLIMPDTLSWFQKIVADIDFTLQGGVPLPPEFAVIAQTI